ncbi:MAG: hypothetical protein KKF77_14980 [Proteobacteria bacterium]|nr:hypothetical protein [Pseudomonadota bacterium]
MQPSPRLMDIELVNICNFRCNFHCNFRCLAYAGSMGEKALSAVRGHDACGQLCRHQPLWSAA